MLNQMFLGSWEWEQGVGSREWGMQRKTALICLKQRSGDDWLVGYDHQEFFALVERVLGELRSRPQPERPLTILLAERDPLEFLAHFIAACAANCRLVLANPDWVETEWQQVFELVSPDIVWGDRAIEQWQTAETQRRRDAANDSGHALPSTPDTRHPTPSILTPHILIPTGGTSGKIRFAVHTWETLMASVQGFCEYFFCEYFEVAQINSFCVLPLYHVSGLMQFLRSFTTGGRLVILPFKAVEEGDRSFIHPEVFFLSLVPTQLQRLLAQEGAERQTAETAFTQNSKYLFQRRFAFLECQRLYKTQNSSIAWLSRFHTVLLGGAPAWSDLLDRARTHRIRLAPTYGMTETASQVATLKPDAFLKGHTSAGQVLPHAQITIRDTSGNILPAHQIGNVTIQSKALAIGYHPPLLLSSPCSHPTPHTLHRAAERSRRNPTPSLFQPDDRGYFDTDGYLHIVGRHSDKIITGGENVYPAEVEAAIRATTLVRDVCVIGMSDRHWGQAITAVYVPLHANTSTAIMQAALEPKLSKFKRPKHWLAVDQLPRNAQGKVNRSHIEAIAKHRLSNVSTSD